MKPNSVNLPFTPPLPPDSHTSLLSLLPQNGSRQRPLRTGLAPAHRKKQVGRALSKESAPSVPVPLSGPGPWSPGSRGGLGHEGAVGQRPPPSCSVSEELTGSLGKTTSFLGSFGPII